MSGTKHGRRVLDVPNRRCARFCSRGCSLDHYPRVGYGARAADDCSRRTSPCRRHLVRHLLRLLIWGLAVALGVGVLLAASHLAYTILRGIGAAYLTWLGAHLVLRSHRGVPDGDHAPRTPASEPAIGRETILAYDRGAAAWFARGLLSNLTNPKVGVFYVTFLPQFVPAGVAVGPFVALLVAVHITETIPWLAALIIATRSMAGFLHRPTVTRTLDRFTGTILIGAGLRLAFEGRR